MNPFHHSLEDNFRGRLVRGVSNDGEPYEGWVERIHHHDRHVVLRDATNLSTGEHVGAALLAHVDVLEEVNPTGRIEAVAPSEVEPSPYHAADFNANENRGYIEEVRDREFAGSFPVARERDDGTLEIVEGHKRLWVCEQANVPEHPVEIVDLSDWNAARRFVADHLPHEGHVHDGETTEDGYYGAVEIRESIRALVERWDDRARDLDRVAFNADRLDIDIEDPADVEDASEDNRSEEDFDDSADTEDAVAELADLDRDEDGNLDHTNEDHLQYAYDAYDGVVADAADEFGVTYHTVYQRLRDSGIHESASTESDADDQEEEEADPDSADDMQFEELETPEWLDEHSWYVAVDMADDVDELANVLGWHDPDRLEEMVGQLGLEAEVETA